MKQTKIYKKTNDDWYPNVNTNEVILEYIGKLISNKFRVACWGNDDFGIEKDFETEIEAINVFKKLKLKKVINHQDLYNLGFTNA